MASNNSSPSKTTKSILSRFKRGSSSQPQPKPSPPKATPRNWYSQPDFEVDLSSPTHPPSPHLPPSSPTNPTPSQDIPSKLRKSVQDAEAEIEHIKLDMLHIKERDIAIRDEIRETEKQLGNLSNHLKHLKRNLKDNSKEVPSLERTLEVKKAYLEEILKIYPGGY